MNEILKHANPKLFYVCEVDEDFIPVKIISEHTTQREAKSVCSGMLVAAVNKRLSKGEDIANFLGYDVFYYGGTRWRVIP